LNVKNYLVVAVLSAMVLALTFIPMSGSQTQRQYDPWLDYNDDGKISLADLVSLAQSYGTTGDPTKNVNVTNWPNWPISQYNILHFSDFNISWMMGLPTYYVPLPIGYVGGYSRMSIFIQPTNMSDGLYNVTVSLGAISWYPEFPGPCCSWDEVPSTFLSITMEAQEGGFTWRLPQSVIVETKAPYFELRFNANSTAYSGWVILDVYVYLRNE